MLSFLFRSISLGLVSAVLILLVFPSLRPAIVSDVTSPKVDNITSLQISFNQAVRRAAPAVVNIYSRKYAESDRSKLLTQGLGSGVIVSEKGYIITNFHVVAQADQIVVALQDGRVAAAQLVGSDKRTDIAILRVSGDNLPVIPLNPNYNANVGDVVLAIGNPYNLGQTTTFGIISATGRSSISADGHQAFIQTDAAINEGNSGGALVNSQGELVGINTASFQQATDMETYGISFAIPYPLANKIMEKIIADGRVIRGYIGIDGQDINSVTSRLLGTKNIGGIVVLGIDPNGPAADAGFEAQDIIVSINNTQVNGRQSVMDIVTDLRPGTVIDVGVLRQGESKTLKVTIAEDTRL
ncbi:MULTISPECIES: outer membrane-stress sensor serine endopeptidase DegS [Vibrio]|uniref:Outer membrane-stress sensor serine endopeptidase DegS n=2 Tax=Vibrio TaxID=662 RepID=A0ABV4LDJ7_9VIBR|nr:MULTISPECIES: outer membrane-stress sensor serine endopeptidase DegS [Vibrio]KAB0463297.1 outer membrane-stress sensor serine endopeptidase DegS [Vibrio kanaloae]NAZ68319.1 outer membrane-stress sensor serine endopeptidase DegS [Vibrio toranzoniae]NOI01208.1 outer membrane-stress sensor serine endopeptidase DegS [Vibrio kanaloae]NOI99077.1 outer membrane-stress sensor serine endopeptidase DegS [Vibrio kanaloae]OEF12088.1 outer membrane-stress sensor serine endopeptidase DegS [Vibrio kanaloa